MARTSTPAPNAARSTADTATNRAPAPVGRRRATVRQRPSWPPCRPNPPGRPSRSSPGTPASAQPPPGRLCSRTRRTAPPPASRAAGPASPTPGRPPPPRQPRATRPRPPRPPPRAAPPTPGSPPSSRPTARPTLASPPQSPLTAPPRASRRKSAPSRSRTRPSPPRPPGTSWPSPRPPTRPGGPSRPTTWTPRGSRPPAPATRPGALRDLVEEHLRQFPDAAFTPHQVGKVLTRSVGAVANALDKLTALGAAQTVTDKPRSYRLAPAPAPDAAGDPGTSAEAAPSAA